MYHLTNTHIWLFSLYYIILQLGSWCFQLENAWIVILIINQHLNGRIGMQHSRYSSFNFEEIRKYLVLSISFAVLFFFLYVLIIISQQYQMDSTFLTAFESCLRIVALMPNAYIVFDDGAFDISRLFASLRL